MKLLVQCFVIIPFLVVMYQFYSWVIRLKGVQRQQHCRALGIVFTTLGTVSFIFRTAPFALVGLLLFMLGMRLLAYSLDRIDKQIFIDRLEDDR